jgi:VIT1/CCC1 family predicted Fe2+/Mn2+ transporter
MEREAILKQLLSAQRNEISEYHTYAWLARRIRDHKNREVLDRIAKEELAHYEVLKRLTKTDVKPHKFRVFRYQLISRVLGLSFGLRLMERGEEFAERLYANLKETFPELGVLFMDEQRHEADILGLIEEERIEYAGSIVLGLNDALMELTGALAGLTLALQNGKVIAMTGFIIGVAASMSMAASEFLSAREEADENGSKNPLKSAGYTGLAYIVTVLVLISPYLLISKVYASALVMMALSVLIILSYNFYITTAKGLRLWRRFCEMASISLGVACVSFFIGMIARTLFGVDM